MGRNYADHPTFRSATREMRLSSDTTNRDYQVELHKPLPPVLAMGVAGTGYPHLGAKPYLAKPKLCSHFSMPLINLNCQAQQRRPYFIVLSM
jgi:hypothetical protein